MTQVKEENLFDIIPEMMALLEEHYEELIVNKKVIKLNPRWDEYKRRIDLNQFAIFTIRAEGKLIGYSAFFIEPHIHYSDFIVATNDVIFLKKNLRGVVDGVKLIKFSQERCKELGAMKITWHVKLIHDFRELLHRMGYEDDETLVSKLL